MRGHFWMAKSFASSPTSSRSRSSSPPVLLVSLPDGDITIAARLVNNDGSELTPSAAASVAIHVAASSAVSLPLVSNGGIALLLAFILVVLILRRRQAARANDKLRVEKP